MVRKRKKASEATLSAEEISLLRELIRNQIEAKFQPPGWGLGGIPLQVVSTPTAPLGSTVTPENYMQIVGSRGEIVNISIKEIEKRLTQVIQSIGNMAQGFAASGVNIAKKIGGAPFELDQITVGISIKLEAGLIVVGVGGDSNLELKFVRTRPSSGTTP